MSTDKKQTDAINRVADALFAQAKEQRRQTTLQERAVTVSEAMLVMQRANLAVSQALEQKLLMEGTDDGQKH